MRRISVLLTALVLTLTFTLASGEPASNAHLKTSDARLKKGSRGPDRNGWIQVHLEGSPAEIGFQHGYLLASEIQDSFTDISTEMQHDEKRDWSFFRAAARNVFWPHVEQEYRDELAGIAAGLKARGVALDLWDVVALNAWLELPYYGRIADAEAAPTPTADHCSAFVATGSYTRDGHIVIGHNSWTSYASGERWNVIFEIVPARGQRIIMDGMPGLIHSGDDFGINAAGLVITETTISGFKGFDIQGVPEFDRARKAMQYAQSIDDFARIMEDGNNGGYANTWLVADSRTNEIASLELGLKNVTLERTRDGFFVGSNFPSSPKLVSQETDFDTTDRARGENTRHERWLTLMAQYKGEIDIAAGQKFLADHGDAFDGTTQPSERTLCGHVDLSPRGMGSWQNPYAPAGTVQNKVTDAAGARKMSLVAAMGHACGLDFTASDYLAKHSRYGWYSPILRDMPSREWTWFEAR